MSKRRRSRCPRRTLPPAAAPLTVIDICNGLKAIGNEGREQMRFIAELRNYFGTRYCFLVSSGKAALTIILQALHDLEPRRNEVLIPAFTCYSVAASIRRAGLVVRLCDIDPRKLDFDETELESCMNRRLLAVVPTHLFGIPARIGRVRKLATDAGVTVVEDAAQAMGGEPGGRKLGTVGDVGFFSLDRGKALSTVAGGIILTDNRTIAGRLAKRIEQLPVPGLPELSKLIAISLFLTIFQYPAMFWLPKSLPFLQLGQTIYKPDFQISGFTSFQAGMARNWQSRLARFQARRCENLRSIVNGAGESFKDFLPGIGRASCLLRLPLLLKNEEMRRRLLSVAEKRGLGIMGSYPTAINGIDALAADFGEKTFPGAVRASRLLVTMPLHPLLSANDIQKLGNIGKWLSRFD